MKEKQVTCVKIIDKWATETVMSWNMTRLKRTYSDGEFVKNIADIVAMLDPNNTKDYRLIKQQSNATLQGDVSL